MANAPRFSPFVAAHRIQGYLHRASMENARPGPQSCQCKYFVALEMPTSPETF